MAEYSGQRQLKAAVRKLGRALAEAFAFLPDPPPLAWQPTGDSYSSLKLCPLCDEVALEGEVECKGCGCEPVDDFTWRMDWVSGRLAAALRPFARVVLEKQEYLAVRTRCPDTGALQQGKLYARDFERAERALDYLDRF